MQSKVQNTLKTIMHAKLSINSKSVCLFSRVWNPKHAKQSKNQIKITSKSMPHHQHHSPPFKGNSFMYWFCCDTTSQCNISPNVFKIPNVICCILKTKQRLAQTETECKVVDSCKTGKDETRWLLSSRP